MSKVAVVVVEQALILVLSLLLLLLRLLIGGGCDEGGEGCDDIGIIRGRLSGGKNTSSGGMATGRSLCSFL